MITTGIPGRVKFLNGNPSVPEAGGLRYIIQIVGTDGKYPEKELSIQKRWPKVSQQYRQFYLEKHGKLMTGEVQSVQVQSDTIVVNMIAIADGKLNLDALSKCFNKIIEINKIETGSIHMAKLASAKEWKDVEKLLQALTKAGLNVTIYQ